LLLVDWSWPVKRPVSDSGVQGLPGTFNGQKTRFQCVTHGLEICFFVELGICRELHSGFTSSLREVEEDRTAATTVGSGDA
jgi:hypothetical protein